MREERLQKVLARAGVASRRAAEALISAGRVRVDGRVTSVLGVTVDRNARIEVDGRVIVAEPLVYVVLHKPRGVVCTLKDPEGRPTVAEYLKDVGARVVPVGRLDFHTSGALICTNDGDLASHLMHPRHHAKKEYVAKVGGVVDERTLERLGERIMIDGRATRPAEVRLLRVEDGKSWVSVKLGEGRNRQVRRLGEHAGVPVMRLVRVAHAGVDSEGLRPGEWRRLSLDELRALKAEYGFPRVIHPNDPNVMNSRGGHLAIRQPGAGARKSHDGPEKPRPVHGHLWDNVERPREGGPAPRDRAPKPHAGARAATSRGPRTETRAPRPEPRAARPESRGGREWGSRPHAESRGPRPDTRSPRADTRSPRPDTRGPRPDTRGPRPDTRGPRPDTRGPRPDTRGPRPDTRGPRTEARGPRPDTRGPRDHGKKPSARGRR